LMCISQATAKLQKPIKRLLLYQEKPHVFVKVVLEILQYSPTNAVDGLSMFIRHTKQWSINSDHSATVRGESFTWNQKWLKL